MRLLSKAQAAKELGVGRETVSDMCRAGQLRLVYVGQNKRPKVDMESLRFAQQVSARKVWERVRSVG